MSPNKDQVQQQDRIQQLLERLGKAYLERQDYAEAYDKFAQLLEIDPENQSYLLNTSIASIGIGRVSQSALELYEKAIDKNRASNALKIGLATLFMQNNVSSPFAAQVCEAAARITPPPPNSHKIRLFLKNLYEETGDTEKLNRIEHEVVFSTQNLETIRSYLEGLWWEGKFSEAETAIKNAPNLNGAAHELTAELLLTNAYRHYLKQSTVADPIVQEQIYSKLGNLNFLESLSALRNYLLLRAILPTASSDTSEAKKEIEEYEFILGDISLDEIFNTLDQKPENKEKKQILGEFNFSQEILQAAERPFGDNVKDCKFSYDLHSILFLQAKTQNEIALPSKLIDLISMQLCKQPDAIVRQFGAGYLSLAKNPLEQIETLIELLRHLDDYNLAMPAEERIIFVAAFSIFNKKQNALNEKTYLNELVKALHFMRFAEKSVQNNASAEGVVFLQADEKELQVLKKHHISILTKGKACLLPGYETSYAEIIWRNPLNMLEKGQSYKINRFELKNCLVKHNSYATYYALDKQLDRPVIVKIMLPAHAVAILENSAKRDELFEKLRAIGRINHPSIANLYDMGEHNNMIFFVREYIEGKPITEHDFNGEQRENEILSMLQTLLRALISAQRQGIAHLNLKSGNIWLSEAQQIKITDFHFTGFGEDFARQQVLYPAQWQNIAPELLAGEFGDFRSDIYSLGILAYELISGQHPYKTAGSINSPKDIHKVKVLPLEQHETPHHPAWDAFVMKAMQTDPDKRFQALAEMELELRKIHMQLMQQALNATSA
jgi:tetratricopeptide (TPR) repeat protein